jgi:hypothetical protein
MSSLRQRHCEKTLFSGSLEKDRRRTHNNDPESQAISWLESGLESEFFKSDALILGRSEPSDYKIPGLDTVCSTNGLHVYTYQVTPNTIKK